MRAGSTTRSGIEGARQPRSARGATALAWEGLFQSLGQGLGEGYMAAFALAVGAGGAALGLLASLPTAATALAQAAAGRLGGDVRRVRGVIACLWSSQALGYAALGLCVLAPPRTAVPLACLAAVFCWGVAGLASPAWTWLVAAVVPRARHGRFFGLRGTLQQCGVLAALAGGGLILGTVSGEEVGAFLVLFAVAAAARLAGAALLALVPPPAAAGQTAAPAATAAWRSSARLRRLSLYLWILHFGTGVSTPVFVPYMLHDLRMSYAELGVLLAVPAATKVLTSASWGSVADRIGPGPLLRRTGPLVALIPLLWIVGSSPWWIAFAQVLSGVLWGAFELAQASALLQTTGGRPRTVGLFNLVDGLTILSGSVLGGSVMALADRGGLPGPFIALGLSSALRLLPAVALLWRVRGIGRPTFTHRLMPLRPWSVGPTRGLGFRPWPGPERPPANPPDVRREP